MFKVIFIIGGPGAGKGTQCSLLVNKRPTKFVHISLGDVLRAEREKKDSKWGEVLRKNLAEGLIGDKKMVVDLLEKKLKSLSAEDKGKVILLDGFPRTLDRALLFQQRICKPLYLFVLDASTDTLKQRLLGRGRDDDQGATLEKRMETWEKESEDVKKYYFRKDGCKLVTIDSNRSTEDIAAHLDREMVIFCHIAGIDLMDGAPYDLMNGIRLQNLEMIFGE